LFNEAWGFVVGPLGHGLPLGNQTLSGGILNAARNTGRLSGKFASV
jgi:hypothetical protein